MTVPSPVAVTGALGFVASRLLPRLIERGARVVALVRPGRDASRLERLGVAVRRAELSAPVPPAAFEGCAAAVHLAGMSLVPPLVDPLERAGVRRVVCVSSAGVYTRLESPAAEAKRAGERALAASTRLEGVVLRPSMIYGAAGDRNVERLVRWVARWPVVPLPGGGHTLQQPVHVDDLVDAILAGLERPEAAGGTFDVGGPRSFPLREMVAMVARACGRRIWVLPIPIGPVHRAIVTARRAGLATPIRPEQVLRLRESKAVDIEPARRSLGFDPRTFEAGIDIEARHVLGRPGPADTLDRMG